MQTKVARTILEIKPECWDQVNQGDTKLKSWAFLRAVEEASINQASSLYIQVFSGRDCIGSSVCSFARTSMVVLAQGFLHELTKRIRIVAPGFLTADLAVGGTLVSSCTNGLSCRESDALPTLIRETEYAARDRGAGFVLFKDFNPDEVRRYAPTFTSLGYYQVASLPGAAIEVAGASSIDCFLTRFRHKYRQLVRKDYAIAQQAGLGVWDERTYGHRNHEFIRLYRQVLDRSPTRFGVLTPAFVAGMARYMGNTTFMKVFAVADQIVALELIVEDGDVLRPLYLGVDYRRRPDRLYYACLYHTLLHGIEHGYSRIELGQKCYEAKARYGANRWPVAMFVKHLQPTLNKVLARVLSRLFPPVDVVERTVLKVSEPIR
jgi:hypothetical protein